MSRPLFTRYSLFRAVDPSRERETRYHHIAPSPMWLAVSVHIRLLLPGARLRIIVLFDIINIYF